jgi:hypothetical protein
MTIMPMTPLAAPMATIFCSCFMRFPPATHQRGLA